MKSGCSVDACNEQQQQQGKKNASPAAVNVSEIHFPFCCLDSGHLLCILREICDILSVTGSRRCCALEALVSFISCHQSFYQIGVTLAR